MASELLDIQPRELKFTFELRKQSSCSIQLFNKSNQYVAFKVKTTSPKSYCVRPNVGVVAPKTTCEFTVTMQAQKTAPPDLECKDKFLVQSIVIPFGSTEEDLKPNLFSKEKGGFIEENKLRVVFVSPDSHHSLVLQPIDGGLDQSPPSDEDHQPREQGTSARNSALSGGIENLHPAYVAKITDVENLKAKLIHLESKLNEAQKSILQLSDEKNSTIQENEKLRQEVVSMLHCQTSDIQRVDGELFLPPSDMCMLPLDFLFASIDVSRWQYYL